MRSRLINYLSRFGTLCLVRLISAEHVNIMCSLSVVWDPLWCTFFKEIILTYLFLLLYILRYVHPCEKFLNSTIFISADSSNPSKKKIFHLVVRRSSTGSGWKHSRWATVSASLLAEADIIEDDYFFEKCSQSLLRIITIDMPCSSVLFFITKP